MRDSDMRNSDMGNSFGKRTKIWIVNYLERN